MPHSLTTQIIHEIDIIPEKEIDTFSKKALTLADLPIIGNTLIGPQASEYGVLLIHGFGGTNLELIYLGNYLARRGYRVFIPLLPGHGTNYQELYKVDENDWYTKIDESYELLKSEKKRRQIFVIGHSLGGTFALYAAINYPEIRAVIALAAPIRFPVMTRFLVKAFSRSRFKIKNGEFVFFDEYLYNHPLIKFLNKSYKFVYLKSINDIFGVMKKTFMDLRKIKCPVLLINSKFDHRVPKKQAMLILDNLSSSIKQIFWSEKSYHVIVFDQDKNKIASQVYTFLEDQK